MYAIIEVGAKQFKVEKGDVIDTEKQDCVVGKDIILDRVMLISKDGNIEVGKPYLKASVKAKVLGQIKADKVMSFKYRRRKSSHWRKGHRKQLTRLEIKEIEA